MMCVNNTDFLNFKNIIDIINLFSFEPSIPLYLLSIAQGLGVIPVVCMSGTKLVGKIVEAMVKAATIQEVLELRARVELMTMHEE